MELRYKIKTDRDDAHRVLQYRIQREETDYSAIDQRTGDYVKKLVWSAWKDVPEVTE